MKFMTRCRVAVLSIALLAVCFVIPDQAYACQITKTFFLPTTEYRGLPKAPFYTGWGGRPATTSVVVQTDNAPDCEGKNLFLSVVAAGYAKPDGGYVPDTPVAGINNISVPLTAPQAELPGDTASTNYGVSFSAYIGEELCADRGPDELQELLESSNTPAANFAYLLTEKDQNGMTYERLYRYLFEDVEPGKFGNDQLTLNEFREAKQILYSEFGLLDCQYYIRASLDTPNPDTYVMQPRDLEPGNSHGFMCELGDTYDSAEDLQYAFTYNGLSATPHLDFVTCNSRPWEKRFGFSPDSSGATDIGDPCVGDDGRRIPDCYEVLAPIPGIGDVIYFEGNTSLPEDDRSQPFALETLFRTGIDIAIGAVSLVAVLALMYVGFQYMQSKNVGDVSKLMVTRERLLGVFAGIAVILGIYVILNTINPELLKLAPTLDEVTLVRDRTHDAEFQSNIQSVDTTGIVIPPGDYSDEVFLIYLTHQQGLAGASSILWSARQNLSSVPFDNPFVNGNVVNRNMKNNIGADFARVTGTNQLTPASFVLYWQKKIEAQKRNNTPLKPDIGSAIAYASQKTGISTTTLVTMCRIESRCDGVNDRSGGGRGSYHGLFQMGTREFNKRVPGGDIYNFRDNSLAAAIYAREHLSQIKKKWNKIMGN